MTREAVAGPPRSADRTGSIENTPVPGHNHAHSMEAIFQHPDGPSLTPLERRLMSLLLAKKGRTVSNRTIHKTLYGASARRGRKAIKFHVMNLRRKLAQLGGWKIETDRGSGLRAVPRSLIGTAETPG